MDKECHVTFSSCPIPPPRVVLGDTVTTALPLKVLRNFLMAHSYQEIGFCKPDVAPLQVEHKMSICS